MTETWQETKAWSDRFIPPFKMLLGLHCIQVADIDEDRRHNTDLMFEVNRARYPVRVRRIEQRLPYNRRNEITVRFRRRSGLQTEFSKLMHGWGDYFIYAWGEEASGRIPAYTVLDLHAMRGYISDIVADRFFTVSGDDGLPLGWTLREDRDQSATLLAICLDCLPQGIVQHRVAILPRDPPITDWHWRQHHDPCGGTRSTSALPGRRIATGR